jgi:hypothetical protein
MEPSYGDLKFLVLALVLALVLVLPNWNLNRGILSSDLDETSFQGDLDELNPKF